MQVDQPRLLLVDDSMMNNMVLSSILKKAGYSHVEMLRDGNAALLRLLDVTQPLPDLVITDMVMPGMSGVELCARIKQTPALAEIPVVMVTASGATETLEQAFEAGVSDYITRPFSARAVLSRLKSVLRLREEMERRQEHERQLEAFNHSLLEDLNMARRLQRQMLPETLAGRDYFVTGRSMPVAMLGGDLYYWERLGEERFCVLLMDIMGHGTATSMICMYLRAMLPDLIRSAENAPDLVRGVNRLMNALNANLSGGGYHCTAQCAMIDLAEGTLEVVSAGHPPAFLLKADGTFGKLGRGCLPLGVLEHLEIDADRERMDGPTCLLLYTDGLVDLMHERRESLEDMVSSLCTMLPHDPPEIGENVGGELIDLLMEAIRNDPREDDLTVVQAKMFPACGSEVRSCSS